MNRLSEERSPYLRHAADQDIDWYPWSEEAFEQAKKEDKPVFLSSGAVWCHWCHVMAQESFKDTAIASLLNKHFISIKLDRDERPDIDRRYQQAVSALGGGGGWPLSVFLTPEKKPFFGGTYFPPDDSLGRPGFKKILETMATLYKTKKTAIDAHTKKVLDFIKPEPLKQEKIYRSLVREEAVKSFTFFDYQNGGFGNAPKFPMPGVLQFLINRYFLSQYESIGLGVKKTLESMARGGIHDQIGGGFHRYSVDDGWIIPHFEKMADDNAWHLRNYIDAYSVFGEEYFREVSEGIIRFLQNTLSDPEGGFYASQDADVTPDDEGGYFTWTDDELRKYLTDDEYKILSLHLLHDRGSMHHDELKKVLFISMDANQIAYKKGQDIHKIKKIIQSGKQKLLNERMQRKAPQIDETFYTSLNGMLITSFLKASTILGDKNVREFALRSLDKILEIRFRKQKLFHTEGVEAVLDDYVYLTEALLSAYEITGNAQYAERADTIMHMCIEKFWDHEEGGFFDTECEVLGLRLKNIEDTSHPSSNSLGILLLLKLFHITKKDTYHTTAKTALQAFSSKSIEFGIHAGYYFVALDAYFHMLTLTVQANPTDELAQTARATFHPYKTISYEDEAGRIIPCLQDRCYEPIETRDVLKDFVYHARENLYLNGGNSEVSP
jgi:uncharacterized protein YyaL (SSP411 family)